MKVIPLERRRFEKQQEMDRRNCRSGRWRFGRCWIREAGGLGEAAGAGAAEPAGLGAGDGILFRSMAPHFRCSPSQVRFDLFLATTGLAKM